MAAIAREPLAYEPQAGIQTQSQDRSDNRPSSSKPVFFSAPQLAGAFDRNLIPRPSALRVDANEPGSGPVIKVLLQSGATVTGKVLDHVSSEDARPHLSEIAFEGMSFAVPPSRAIQVPGNFGTLTVSASGTFSYSRAGERCGFTEAFICTARAAGPNIVRITLEIASDP